ncbi:MAG TPA: cobalamin-independent methionine synthase II family protein [Chloroflexota bacterium]
MPARSDVVGSLLRPPELLAARRTFEAGELDPAELARIEDRAVDQAIALQEACRLEVVTDGELRRRSFQDHLAQAVDGLGEVPLEAYLWGQWHSAELGGWNVPRPARVAVLGKLRRRGYPVVEEFTYLRSRTSRVAKVAVSSPSLYANLWSPGGAYTTLEAFLDDVAELVADEVQTLAGAGVQYIQLDAPHYALVVDPRTRGFYEAQGWSAERWLDRGVELDNDVMGAAPGVTFGLHLCRGNQRSRWLVSGGYEPLARVFERSRTQRLLLEYDDARSGSFEPLRLVPDDKTVVLGLVSTKSGRLEDQAELEARIQEAAGVVGSFERLAISPQCGFASSLLGNELTVEDQRRKLELVAQTARAVWGEALT